MIDPKTFMLQEKRAIEKSGHREQLPSAFHSSTALPFQMSRSPDPPTDSQRRAADELKKRMRETELYGGDALLYRFLKVQDFDVDKAETLLREHLRWRRRYDVGNISQFRSPEVLEKYLSLDVLGHDREGSVLHYLAFGTVDWIGLTASSRQEELAKHVIRFFEQDFEDLRRYKERTGKAADGVLYIVNMEGISFAQATSRRVISCLIFLVHLYQDNYPEMLRAIHIINGSKYFYLMYSIMKNFLPQKIIDLLKMYPDGSWKDVFSRSIDADVLPAFLGGSRTDPDGNPMCFSFINHGGPVPERYHIHRAPDCLHLNVPRRDRREIRLQVPDSGCHLEWEFDTEGGSVAFGVFRDHPDGTRDEIVPTERRSTREKGICKCDQVGTYIVVFDNTHSALRKKDIFYKVKVIKPQAEESGSIA